MTLAVTLALLLGSVAFKAYRLTLPTDGWSLAGPVEAPAFERDLLRAGGPLQPGDVLLGVNGVPYADLIAGAVAFHPSRLAYRSGGVATYAVSRGGAELEVQVPLGNWSGAGLLGAARQALTDTPFGGVYRWLTWLLAAFLFARRPRNRAVRILFVLESVTTSMAISAVVAPVTVADTLSPAVFYAARVWGELLTWLVLPPLALHFLLTFPDSRPVRRGTLLVAYATPWVVLAAVWVTRLVLLVPLMAGAYSVANVVVAAALVVRHGNGPERASVRWLAFGFGSTGALSLLFWLGLTNALPRLTGVSSVLFEHCMCDLVYVSCIAIALLRHQLFDIDVIIRRTLVYGGLTVCVAAVYVVLVGGAGRLLGSSAGLPLSLATVGVLALAFDPLRSRLQRLVNRLVYGYRDEPYVVLQDLGRRLELAVGPGSALQEAARSIRETLRLPFVAVEVGGATLASHGTPGTPVERFEMTQSGEHLGSLLVSPRAGEERLPTADRRLVGVLAGQVAKTVRALVLEADLERSRLASLNAREEARRRLGFDLHDDVGSRLTALVRQAERAGQQIDADPLGSKASLARLVNDVKLIADRVRRLAHELHPPELALLGLVEAVRERLTALGDGHDLIVQLDAEALGELPAAVEFGAYAIVQEALANVKKHANAHHCRVSLHLGGGAPGLTAPPGRGPAQGAASGEQGAGSGEQGALSLFGTTTLLVEVSDDGVGVGGDQGAAGLGLASMTSRATELGGTLSIGRPRGGGTSVRLEVPLTAPPKGTTS